MKTLHLFMGLILLAAMPLNCEGDTSASLKQYEIEDFENGSIVLELQLELHSLSVKILKLNEREKELIAILERDPSNEKAMEELKKVRRETKGVKNRGEAVNRDLKYLDIGPIPIPPVCDCPFPFRFRFERMLIQNQIEDIELTFIDVKSSEVLYQFDNFKESEFEEFRESYFKEDPSRFPDEFMIKVIKKVDNEIINYELLASFKK